MDSAVEAALRVQIMDWVLARAEANGGFLHRHELLGFRIDGRDLPLIDYSRGIRNPSEFTSTLSIVSSAAGPYDDTESDDGLLHYAYRKGDPFGGDNRKLRTAMDTGMPLILFRKEQANYLTPVMPVYVVDDEPERRGVPTTPNGLALCKIHHAAFDQHILGVTPGHRVQVRADVLAEVDGPMLRHGIQAMHGRALTLPRRAADRPDRELLAVRWEMFAGR